MSDTLTADAFAAGQREARESDRLDLVAALDLDLGTPWAEVVLEVLRLRSKVATDAAHNAEVFATGVSVHKAYARGAADMAEVHSALRAVKEGS